jgi:hypothetical protein
MTSAQGHQFGSKGSENNHVTTPTINPCASTPFSSRLFH